MSVVQRDRALHDQLARLARTARMVFVAGLPGTGKSLVINQLAHQASAEGRVVHLLQWDVARPVFEASPAGRRHPVVDGVTQPVIRKAVGAWARRMLPAWAAAHPPREHVLLGETPLIGDRLLALARPCDDDAEPLLAEAACVFAVPVPSVEVRRHVEAERERRASAPRHAREREDAPPPVLRDLWRQLLTAARALGLTTAADGTPYDPSIYRGVYETLLRHRTTEIVSVETVLPLGDTSVYDFSVSCVDVIPREDEADALVRETEHRHPDQARLAREVDTWWRPDPSRR
jgi:hypothetical protein